MVKAYEYHELANILPLMEGDEYESFKASIAASESIAPVVLHEGKILDGRNRYRAGRELNLSVPFTKWDGEYGSPEAFVKAVNFDRRHLTTSQKALVAERLNRAIGDCTQVQSGQEDNRAQNCAREQLAESFGVSERSIDNAAKVLDSGAAAVVAAVESGDVSISDAASVADLSKAEQAEALKAVKKGKAKTLKAAASGKPRAPKKPKEPKEEKSEGPPLDQFKYAVPEYLQGIFSQARRMEEAMQAISNTKKLTTKLTALDGAAYLDHQEVERLLTQARHLLRFAMPYTECPKCRRKLDKQCQACKGEGWIHESMYSSVASDADKAWIERRK